MADKAGDAMKDKESYGSGDEAVEKAEDAMKKKESYGSDK